MAQNIYDNPDFFAGYKELRDTGWGLNEVLEQPALRALLPPLAGATILELGCGMGQFARSCCEQGAAHITAVDVSERMLEVARRENAHSRIEYLRCAIETLELPTAHFDCVVSSLAFHYIQDYAALVRAIHLWLRPGGALVFSVEHPIVSAAGDTPGWIKDPEGRKLYWAVDNYAREGERVEKWFVDGVMRYHRTLATYINTLTENGFRVARVEEPEALPEAHVSRPTLEEESRRPPFLLIKAIRE